MIRQIAAIFAAGILSVGPAHAASGSGANGTGSAKASVIAPFTISYVSDLQFGEIAQPNAAGTMTVSPVGVVTTTAGVTGNESITQIGSSRSAGQFSIVTDPGALMNVNVIGGGSITITNAAGNTMTVSNLVKTLNLVSSTSKSDNYAYRIGGRLTVAANQAVGAYSGTYTILVVHQ